VAAGTALQAGNWPTAQKDLAATIGQTSALVKEITASLAKAPSKVRAAAKVGLKLFPAESKAVSNSTSVTQFEKAEEAATDTAQFKKISAILLTYQTAQCGSPAPTT
jgi:predicted signal transduction protein with EAL and GGDEF domain